MGVRLMIFSILKINESDSLVFAGWVVNPFEFVTGCLQSGNDDL